MDRYRETEESTRRRTDEAEEENRERRRVLAWVLVSFAASLGAGLLLCALGLHSTDSVLGPTLFRSGVLLTNIGILATLLFAYQRLGR